MKKGRKTVFSEKELLFRIMEYYRSDPTRKIKVSELASVTGISRNTWYRCAAAVKRIDDLNNVPFESAVSSAGLPTITEIRLRCGDDINEYVVVISQLLDIIAEKTKHETGIGSEEVLKLQEENRRLKIINKRLNDKLNISLLEEQETGKLNEFNTHMKQVDFDKLFGEFFDD